MGVRFELPEALTQYLPCWVHSLIQFTLHGVVGTVL